MKTKTKRKPIEKVDGFHFDKEAHVYTLDGKPMHGVTSVLGVIAKPALIQWSANMAVDYILENSRKITEFKENGVMKEYTWFHHVFDPAIIHDARTAHNKKKTDAGTLGTDVHAQIEEIVKRAIEECDGYLCIPDQKSDIPQVQKFVAWAMENNVRFLESEKQVYSKESWTAGTTDVICEINGRRFVGDIKTSSAIYPEHFIQCSAYARMAMEMGLYDKFDGVIIINLPKKGGLNIKQNYDIDGNYLCFLACLTIYKQLKAISN